MAIARDEHPNKVIIKSAQVGATALLIGFALWSASAGAKVMYFLPDDKLISDHAAIRIKPVIDSIPWLREKVKNREAVETIGIDRGVIYNRGLKSKMSKFSTPADILVFDEVDRAAETDVFTALSRVEASSRPAFIYGSTPTLPGYGITRRYEQLSDARALLVKCPHCGDWTGREWLGGVVRKAGEYDYQLVDGEWNDGCGRDIRVHCLKCGRPLDPTAPAEWVAAYPGRDYHGYRIGPLDIARHPAAKYWLEMRDIIGNETLLTIFFNERLGLAYAAAGAKLDVVNLDAARGDHLPVAACAEPCVLGADVGQMAGHRYWVVHLASSRVIAIGNTDWAGLDALYGSFNLVGTIIDGEPETTRAVEFQRSHPNVYLADYPPNGNHGVYIDIRKYDDAVGGRILKIILDRNVACDSLVDALRKRELILPRNAAALGDPVPGKPYNSFYAEMMAPVRKVEKGKTGPRAVWDEGGAADHYFHAGVYATAIRAVCPTSTQNFGPSVGARVIG